MRFGGILLLDVLLCDIVKVPGLLEDECRILSE